VAAFRLIYSEVGLLIFKLYSLHIRYTRLSMPPGTPHQSFILPYRIRVDDFTTPRDQHFEPPALYLLSHTHSDHISGLSAKSFGARVVCSVDAKHMLLNYEYALDRIAFDKGEIPEKRRPYAHLKIDHIPSTGSKRKSYSRDLLVNTYRFSFTWGSLGDSNFRERCPLTALLPSSCQTM
jgi:hypothetical protein